MATNRLPSIARSNSRPQRDIIGPSGGFPGMGTNTGGTNAGGAAPSGQGNTPPSRPNLIGLKSEARNITLPNLNPEDYQDQPNGGMAYMRDLLERESQTLQELENEQAERLRGTEGAFGEMIDYGVERIGEFDDAARRAEALGRDIREETQNRVRMTESEFRNDSAQAADAASIGVERNIDSQIQQIRSDPSIPESVKQGQIRMLEQQKLEKKTQAVTQASTTFNQAMASLRSQGTQALQQGGASAQAGQQLGSSIRTAAANSLAQFSSMVPQLHQMQLQSPRSLVSMFAGLTALIDLGTTQGGMNAAGVATGADPNANNTGTGMGMPFSIGGGASPHGAGNARMASQNRLTNLLRGLGRDQP